MLSMQIAIPTGFMSKEHQKDMWPEVLVLAIHITPISTRRHQQSKSDGLLKCAKVTGA